MAGYPPMEAQGAMPSMILGIISLVVTPIACCCGFGAIVPIVLGVLAIVFGYGARQRVNASQGTLGGGGKATAGIVTGAIAVGVALVLVVISLTFTGLNLTNRFPFPSPS